MQVRLNKSLQVHVLCGEDLYKVIQQILLRENKIRRNQEHFWVVGMNARCKILFIELVSLGATNRLTIAPPEVFRMGIYKLASQVIFVHNHPNGTMHPSEADKNMTDRMLKAEKIINIAVTDHLIISEESYFSFKDVGLIEEFSADGLWEVIPREKVELEKMKHEAELKRTRRKALLEGKEKGKAEGLLEGEKKGKEKRNQEIAKEMLLEGKPIEKIKRWTGLSQDQIEKLQ